MSNPGDPNPEIPPPPGGLGPIDEEEIVDQDELRPPLPPLDTNPMPPMPEVPPGPEGAVPPLTSTEAAPQPPATTLEDEADAAG